MNRAKSITMAGLLTLLAFGGAAWAQHDAEGEVVTLKGEVIDLQCYLVHAEKGPDHAKCAEFCIKKGLPVGFLTEKGKLYLLLGPGHDNVQELAGKAGQTISLKGTLLEHDGMPAFQLKKEGSSHPHP
ncbi:MAG: hypothetical protein V3T83_17460 [Acidobacteriota bacterium]